MKSIRSKLNNSQGVSIIIALVFMLICLFVGGTVLTAATVNAGRVKNVKRNEKFMDYRSAAMLLADELKPADGKKLGLEIVATVHKTRDVEVYPNGRIEEKGKENAIANAAFRLSHDPETLTPLQRMVLESAMKDYQKTISTPIPVEFERNGITVKVDNYAYLTDFDVDDFYIHGQLDGLGHEFKVYCYRGTEGNKTSNPYDLFFKFNWPKNHELYSEWTEEEMKQPKIDVRMYSDSPIKKELPPVEKIVKKTNNPNQMNPAVLHTDITTVTSIIWQGPRIVKGDAE